MTPGSGSARTANLGHPDLCSDLLPLDRVSAMARRSSRERYSERSNPKAGCYPRESEFLAIAQPAPSPNRKLVHPAQTH